MNISTGLVLPKKVICRSSDKGCLNEKHSMRTESDSITILLGIYSYDAEDGTHSGSIVRVQTSDDGPSSFSSEEIPHTGGPGVFFMLLVLKNRCDELVTWNTTKSSDVHKYLLVCGTDGAVRILSAGVGLETSLLQEKASLAPTGEPAAFKAPAMCTSCDISSVTADTARPSKKKPRLTRCIDRLKTCATKLRKLFQRKTPAFEFMWFPVSETRLPRPVKPKHAAVPWDRLVATYSDGFSALYAINPSDIGDHAFVHRFQAHDAEVWCCRIHSYTHKGEARETVFSTGADDGLWKLWRCEERNSCVTISLITATQHPAGVVSICALLPHFSIEPSEDAMESQLVLVGCYDEHIRLYDLACNKPALRSKVKVPGGPWRISQHFSIDHPNTRLATGFNECCTCVDLRTSEYSHFLVACMYGGHCVVHYHPDQGLFKCDETRDRQWTSKVLASAETADREPDELTYLANWVPFEPSERFSNKEMGADHMKRNRFATASYYDRLFHMY